MPDIPSERPIPHLPRRPLGGPAFPAALLLALLLPSAGPSASSSQRPGPEKRLRQPTAKVAQPPAPAEGAPAPEGPHPTVQVVGGEEAFDFGSVWPGEALKHAFKLTNTGDAELVILRVKPG